MSIGETAANGVNHTPSGTESGEENISEVLANAAPSDTREGFIGHTPGRWMWQPDFHNWITDKNHNCIAAIFDSRFIPDEEQKANARLIAAAPDLLAALKLARSVRMLDNLTAEQFASIDAAILKAESQS